MVVFITSEERGGHKKAPASLRSLLMHYAGGQLQHSDNGIILRGNYTPAHLSTARGGRPSGE